MILQIVSPVHCCFVSIRFKHGYTVTTNSTRDHLKRMIYRFSWAIYRRSQRILSVFQRQDLLTANRRMGHIGSVDIFEQMAKFTDLHLALPVAGDLCGIN